MNREAFEAWAHWNIGQPDFSGYHGTGGVWRYNHMFVNMAWGAWQAGYDQANEENHG